MLLNIEQYSIFTKKNPQNMKDPLTTDAWTSLQPLK
jgi:hypothetical protein